MRRSLNRLAGWKFETVKSAQTGREATLVTMTTSPVNSQGPQWLTDFEDAAKTLRSGPRRPVVLAGAPGSATFCAGLDLIYLFGDVADRAQSRERTTSVLTRLGNGIMEWLSLPLPTVAAVGGHALAGGAILANACDFRVGIKGSKAQFGAVEVPVGVPFPPFAFQVTMAATPIPLQRDAILFGRRFSHDEALALHLFKRNAASPDQLIEEAIAVATELDDKALQAYGLVKEQFSDPLVARVNSDHVHVFPKVLDLLFSDAGYANINGKAKALMNKKKN